MSRLIVFTPNWLGDAVMALPAIADLQRQAPGASLAVAARASIAPLFGLVSGIDEVVVIEKGGAPAYEAAGGTRPHDVAVLLPNSFQSALAAWRRGIPERWGYRTDWRGPLLTRAIEAPSGLHQVDYYQRLV
ncbi:MAG TPA: hypothetical protein VJK49_04150, partial [Candidatus Limnocylindrales bacterium]|nr:hypothetical protein [Candidatus Limnocylindrales bacterium]